MVIWIVFTAVDSDVGIDPHRIPHQGERRVGAYGLVTALVTPIHAGDLRESVMLRCASWCQLQRAPLGKWLNLLIMPGSRVRVPPFPPIESGVIPSGTERWCPP